ncbi:putative aldehyde oxygenase (deformylating) [Rosa chinensis]|uniref:Putative aldehyde oxygenase (Deformylating) n=1 Tax=Rosa chinensis TaxID=74649 RepID=A0A2P6SE93_ROSCH|nr:putative aldehyde oxygenase (deformylating) [Rosa chinensis]
MWPVTLWSVMLTWIYGRTFVVERQRFDKLKLQTWYLMQWENDAINNLLEKAILEAEEKGIFSKFLWAAAGHWIPVADDRNPAKSPMSEELNRYGGLYVSRHPQLKIRMVDGSSLVVAVILNSVPKETTQVLLRGKLTKVAVAIAFGLIQRGIKVAILHQAEYWKLTKSLSESESRLVLEKNYGHKIWLVGNGLSEQEQLTAPKGTIFVPFSQFPPRKLRRDCYYHCTPAMKIPKALEKEQYLFPSPNSHQESCGETNWLPRRVMSAWRIAGIVHALEGWNDHECGYTMSDIDKVWQATLRHGFQPLIPTTTT